MLYTQIHIHWNAAAFSVITSSTRSETETLSYNVSHNDREIARFRARDYGVFFPLYLIIIEFLISYVPMVYCYNNALCTNPTNFDYQQAYSITFNDNVVTVMLPLRKYAWQKSAVQQHNTSLYQRHRRQKVRESAYTGQCQEIEPRYTGVFFPSLTHTDAAPSIRVTSLSVNGGGGGETSVCQVRFPSTVPTYPGTLSTYFKVKHRSRSIKLQPSRSNLSDFSLLWNSEFQRCTPRK